MIGIERLSEISEWLPAEIWVLRDKFFYDGMQLEVGPCFRDYSAPAFFLDATARSRGTVRLRDGSALEGYVAGWPFHPDELKGSDPTVGLKWAWNVRMRYQAGGGFGPNRQRYFGGDRFTREYVGETFFIPILGRAERPADGYRFPLETEAIWIAGGETHNRSDGSVCRWQQRGHLYDWPEFFVYVPELRRVRRAEAQGSEGAFGACLSDSSFSYTVRGEHVHRYEWRVVRVADILAPINSKVPVFPDQPERDFGPSNVSFARDRWELRRALVLEGLVLQKQVEDGVRRFVWYLDLQTLTPLYYASFRGDGSGAAIGAFAGRWSEDTPAHPRWADDPTRPVRVVNIVASGLLNVNGMEALRSERWSYVGVLPDDQHVKRMASESFLKRGR